MSTFSTRHIGLNEQARTRMLELIGAPSLEALMDEALPSSIRLTDRICGLPSPASEADVESELAALAAQNRVRTSMIGQGFYDVILPPVIRRAILENPSWYTAYTPYQPEISQGRLEALLNFQTIVAETTALPIAGASLLDESSASVESLLMAVRITKRTKVAIDSDIFASTRAVIENRAVESGLELLWVNGDTSAEHLEGCAAYYTACPAASGRVGTREEYEGVAQAIHEAGGLFILCGELLSGAILTPAGELGADIAVGSAQRLGLPMSGGGPHAAYIATREKYERQLPGRLVGISKDSAGHLAYRLALQTREQHIRREKATSNICTAQALLAIIASMYAIYHGGEGLQEIARTIHRSATHLAEGLSNCGIRVTHRSFFDTLDIHLPGRATGFAQALLAQNITTYLVNEDRLRISTDERTTSQTISTILQVAQAWANLQEKSAEHTYSLEPTMERRTPFLTHPVFNSHRSETSMMRYMRELAAKDYALDRGMIPLGSCTMKLNAAVEVSSITLEGFSRIHPFAPAEDLAGFAQMRSDMETWLGALTGYDAVSLQPNAGSQGELAGLLAIRAYHRSRGEEREFCLIPASAHGTNAASAALAGFRVLVVRTGNEGGVDMEHLGELLAEHGSQIGAIMLTYPSTHGIYESNVSEIAAKVHSVGGQVYVDGANFNALVAWARMGDFGGDVSHLNLHKTFAIPHGGGGPGIGPVAAKTHLAQFLPGFPGDENHVRPGGGALTSAPWGSLGVLPISWAYLRLMGVEGLTQATACAVLAANYVAERVAERIPVLYRGPNGRVAHECIIDVRGFKVRAGVSVDDVAKRLIDYGFHAPTMSFPVPGTLMVEPTESEDLEELDRFCDSLLAIAEEVDALESGQWSAEDNPLVNAPHTARSLVEEWEHPYSREVAAYPGIRQARRCGRGEDVVTRLVDTKYWPPVGRIDGAWGDRHFQCTCPLPIEAAEK